MAALADELPFLQVVAAFVFRVSPARSSVVKLCRTADDVVAAITNLRGSKAGIKLGGVRGRRILERPENDPVADMAGGAGHALFLVFGIIVGVGLLDSALDSRTRNAFDDGRLLVFQWRVAVETDPGVFILGPIGMEERVLVGIRMNARFPFVIDFGMTGAARFRLQACKALRNLLIGNRMGIIRP